MDLKLNKTVYYDGPEVSIISTNHSTQYKMKVRVWVYDDNLKPKQIGLF